MKLYQRGNVWWARWGTDGVKTRRSTKTTHRDEAEAVVASWGRKVDLDLPLRPSGPRRRGLLYFMRARGTDRVKIGFTQRAIEVRQSDIQMGCPFPLDLLATLPTWRLEELHYHQLFATSRVMPNAEWFVLTKGLDTAVEEARQDRTICPRCTT